MPTRTSQDAKWFPYPPPPFLLHNFNVDLKSSFHYAKNNPCRGAVGNTLPRLSFLLRPFQSASPGLSHNPAILCHWCRGHTISCNTIPCFVVPSILHIPGPARTSSDLWRQRFSFRKKRTGQRQLSFSCFSTTCPCHDPVLQAPTLAEQSTPACWSQTLTARDPQLGDHHLLHQTEFPCGLAQVSIVPGQGH